MNLTAKHKLWKKWKIMSHNYLSVTSLAAFPLIVTSYRDTMLIFYSHCTLTFWLAWKNANAFEFRHRKIPIRPMADDLEAGSMENRTKIDSHVGD